MIKEKSKIITPTKNSSNSKKSIGAVGKIDSSILMYDNYTPPISESLAKELDEAILEADDVSSKSYTLREIFKIATTRKYV